MQRKSEKPRQKVEASETLRQPMVACLKRVIGELGTKIALWNQEVKGKIGVDMDLRIHTIRQVSDDEWVIQVTGKSWTGQEVSEVFSIRWIGSIHPCFFQLFIWERREFDVIHCFCYHGLLSPESKQIAMVLAIHTYHQQIPGILDRRLEGTT